MEKALIRECTIIDTMHYENIFSNFITQYCFKNWHPHKRRNSATDRSYFRRCSESSQLVHLSVLFYGPWLRSLLKLCEAHHTLQSYIKIYRLFGQKRLPPIHFPTKLLWTRYFNEGYSCILAAKYRFLDSVADRSQWICDFVWFFLSY